MNFFKELDIFWAKYYLGHNMAHYFQFVLSSANCFIQKTLRHLLLILFSISPPLLHFAPPVQLCDQNFLPKREASSQRCLLCVSSLRDFALSSCVFSLFFTVHTPNVSRHSRHGCLGLPSTGLLVNSSTY
jgi:hypothetical protein